MKDEVHFATPDETAKVDALMARMVRSVDGEVATLVAVAAIRIAVGLWKLGGASRAAAEAVSLSHVDIVFGDGPKPN